MKYNEATRLKHIEGVSWSSSISWSEIDSSHIVSRLVN